MPKHPDPVEPKRPVSAYFFFVADKRAEVAQELFPGDPQPPFPKIAVRLGQMWKDCTDEERQLYVDKAAEDKDRYELEMDDFKSAQEKVKRRK